MHAVVYMPDGATYIAETNAVVSCSSVSLMHAFSRLARRCLLRDHWHRAVVLDGGDESDGQPAAVHLKHLSNITSAELENRHGDFRAVWRQVSETPLPCGDRVTPNVQKNAKSTRTAGGMRNPCQSTKESFICICGDRLAIVHVE